MTTEIELLKTGVHTASSGQRVTFSEQDLARCAASYSPDLFDAPLVVGHPTMAAPAYGWVEKLSFADGTLRAAPRQVDPAFAEIVKAGRFKKVSASLFSPNAPGNPRPGTYYLRHVGFLGAAAPAIKGLKPVQFADDGDGILSFNDEAADLADRERKLAEREAVIRLSECASFVDRMVEQGRVLPREQEGVVAFMAELDNNGVIEFAESNGGPKKTVGRLDWFRKLLSERPPLISFGEFAPAGGAADTYEFSAPEGFTVDPAGVDLRSRALAYQRQHNVPFDVAVRAVTAHQGR